MAVHTLDQLIHHLYEGVLSPESWTASLLGMSSISHSPCVSIMEFDALSSQGVMAENHGLAPETQQAYNDHYQLLDEARTVATHMPAGAWYHDLRDLGRDTIRHSAYYQEFFIPHGLSTIACNRLVDGEHVSAFLSLQRRHGQAAFTEHDFRLTGQFLPHLQRAMRLRLTLRAMNNRAGRAQLMLDQLSLAMLVLDPHSVVLHTNAPADTLLQRLPQLLVRSKRLEVQGLRSGEFACLVHNACGLGPPREPQAGGVLLRGLQGQTVLQVLVLPLPASLLTLNPWQRPMCLVVLGQPDHSPASNALVLRQLYGLTPAEARVAQALDQGDSIQQAAEHLGISVGTARIQLKAVFAKTGATRQAELIRLLSVLRLVG